MNGFSQTLSFERRDWQFGNQTATLWADNRAMVEMDGRDRTGIGRSLRMLAAGVALALFLTAAPAFAENTVQIGKLRIGVVAKPGAGAAIAGVATLERSFSRALGLPVAVFVARDFPTLIDAHASNRVDYAIYSATAYAVVSRLCGCIEPIVAPVAADGATGARTVLILRAGAAGVPQGLRIATVAGEALPWALLAGGALPAPTAGGRAVEVPVPDLEMAERLFVEGSIDGFFGWAPDYGAGQGEGDGGTLARLAAAGVASDDVEIGWVSDPVRFGPHAVRADIPRGLKDALRRLLTRLRDADPDAYDILEEERQGGFAPVAASDYAILEALFEGETDSPAAEE